MDSFQALNLAHSFQGYRAHQWVVHDSHDFLTDANEDSSPSSSRVLLPRGPSIASTNDESSILYQGPATQEEIISAPFRYLAGLPGKNIRGRLISAFNELFCIPEKQMELIKRVVGLLHTASLLCVNDSDSPTPTEIRTKESMLTYFSIDDIEDSSRLRRGFPVAHSIYGVPQTINSANYTYFQAQSDLLGLDKPDALKIFTEELLRLHKGQGMDLYWRDSLICPNEQEYLEMVSNKTGGLFRLAIKLIQMESQVKLDCVPLVDRLAMAFQIRDDYQNLQSDQYAKNKGFAEDITEGKFSFPIIHSIRSTPNNHELINILRQKTEDADVKLFAIGIIESTKSFAYTKQKLETLTAGVRRDLVELGVMDHALELESICDFMELKG